MQVKAFGHDHSKFEHALGKASTTDDKGQYTISYTDADIKNTDPQKQDTIVQVKVYGLSGKQIDASKPQDIANRKLTIHLKVDYFIDPVISLPDRNPVIEKEAIKLKQFPNLSNLSVNKAYHFYTTPTTNKVKLIDQWTAEKSITNKNRIALLGSIDLMSVSTGNSSIVSLFSENQISTSAELIKYDSKTLGKLISDYKDVPEKGKDAVALAADILKNAESQNPSTFFMHRLVVKPEFSSISSKIIKAPTKHVKSFYSKNKEFDLMTEPIISATTGQLNDKIKISGKVSPELIKDLSNTQQALHLGRDTDLSILIYSKDLNISKTMNMSYTGIMKKLGVDASTAMQIKGRAQEQHEIAMNGFFAYRDILANPLVSQTLGSFFDVEHKLQENWVKGWGKIAKAHGLKDLDNITDLFGSQNYCECDHCRSVLSPAAYFVDLMQFVEKRVLKKEGETESILDESHSIHLKTRRPDLWKLPLTCENTNNNVPYVRILVEVLSSFVQSQLGNSKTVEKRLADEKSDLEFSLPYNHVLEKIRQWLSFFDTNRLDLLEHLYPTPNAAQQLMLAMERLGLSKESYNIIIKQNHVAKVDKDVLKFRLKSGLTAEQTESFAALSVWNNKLNIIQKVDSSDLQKMSLEFKSTLSNWQGIFHRLFRLWKSTGLDLKQFDLLCSAIGIKYNSINKDAVLQIAKYLKVQDLLGLDLDKVTSIFNGIPDTSEDAFSWNNILPEQWITDQEIDIQELLDDSTDKAIKLNQHLQSIYGVTSSEVGACVEMLSTVIATSGGTKVKFNKNTLNTIYQYIQLYLWTGLSSISEYNAILTIWGNGSFNTFDNSINKVVAFLNFVNSITEYEFELQDIIYIFDKNGFDTTVNDESTTYLSSESTQTLIQADTFVTGDKFSVFFNDWLSIEPSVLQYFRGFIDKTDVELNALFTSLSTAVIPDASIIELSNIKHYLERLNFVTIKAGLQQEDLIILSEELSAFQFPKMGFTDWDSKGWVTSFATLGNWLTETSDLVNFDLWEILIAIENDDMDSDAFRKAIQKWKGIGSEEVNSIMSQSNSITQIDALLDKMEWIKKLNLNNVLLSKLKTGNNLSDLVETEGILSDAMRSTFPDNLSYETGIKELQSKLDSKLRDALVAFILYNKSIRAKNLGFENVTDLYNYFLLDITMSDCFELPRIVVAKNSVQTYINRCLLGLEVSADEKYFVILDLDEKEEWEWRKNYRVWEANRKIFLFPENYIEPEIRDNKTPEFKELEDELLQQKLDLEVVENAYKKYLHQVMKLAELKIAGAYLDTDDKIYLFGRTSTQPNEYYYRHVELIEDGARIWSNWEKMNVSIPSEDVSAARVNNKLYVFWTSYQRRDISLIDGGDQELHMHVYDVFVNYTYQKIDGKWSQPQTIDMGYRETSKFDPYLRIDEFEDLITNRDTSEIGFAEEAENIRENVLKSFQNTVYRKPYPSIVPTDSNELSMDFIWTDKKDALVPVYRYSRAIVESFEVDIPIIIQRDYWWDGEDDKTFFFKRWDRIVKWPDTAGQSTPPSNFTIDDQIRSFSIGDDILEFKMIFNTNDMRYRVVPLDSSGNDTYLFKNLNEVANGSFTLEHVIDHVPLASVKKQNSIIDLTHQKLKSMGPETNITQMHSWKDLFLNNEYNLYYDNFNAFYVGDESSALRWDYSIQNQREFVSELEAPGEDAPITLNPEGLQMLWRKVSTSVNDLLYHVTQNHVKDQIDYDESFGNYFYEIFFHIPMRIADHLNAAGKYREADIWYRYIYDPTNAKDEFESLAFPADVNWNFSAFREIGIKKLKAIYSNENAIEQYRRNPGNPHAIARMRISSYQKNTVMKYLDNLLDWADYLFEQFTPESTSEARQLYAMVKNILGDKPMSVGDCKVAPPMAYEDIDFDKNEATGEFIYNTFKKVPLLSSSKIGNKKRGTYKGKFNAFLDSKAGVKKYNYQDTSNIYSKTAVKSDSKFNNKDISSYRRYDVKKTGEIKKADYLDKNRRFFDKVYGRPSAAVKYIDVKSDLIFCFPNNDTFLAYWDRVDDRIYKLNNCLDINGTKRVMPAFAPPIDPALLAKMVGSGLSFDDLIGALNSALPNHRFVYLVEKAKQFCGTVQGFGSALFSAIEKKDSEELTLLRSVHEQNIISLTTKSKQSNLEQAQVSLNEALQNQLTLEMKINHYDSLIQDGLIPWEQTEQIAKWTAGSIRIGEGILQLLSGGLRLVPQIGSPMAMKYGGFELGDSASRFASAADAIAKIADNVAMLAGMEGSNQRREQGWQFQLDSLTEEAKSVEQQVRNAELRVAHAEHDILIHEKSIEQYKELHDFYTTKFSNFDHYTFQVGQLQSLHKMAYNLAYEMSTDAQRSYNFERGLDLADPGIIDPANWNAERAGLLAGENLMLQLQQLEKDFIDTDVVKKEITQHFSLKQINPEKLLELKLNGSFDGFTIPEAAFDLIYPGFYRRRIKSVRISLPCITGPYTNIGATLKLEASKLRNSADASAGALTDFTFNGSDFIATSSAQNDGGQFELNFGSNKYLPFEGAGAISTWGLSLPTTVRAFDYNSISDVIFHISYEAEFDGVFKTTVESNVKTELDKLNGTKSIRVFSLRHDFPNDWYKLNLASTSTDIEIELQREHFPFFTSLTDFEGLENFSFVLKSDNNLEKKTDSLGINKSDTLKIQIPLAIRDLNHKDVIFFVSYKVN